MSFNFQSKHINFFPKCKFLLNKVTEKVIYKVVIVLSSSEFRFTVFKSYLSSPENYSCILMSSSARRRRSITEVRAVGLIPSSSESCLCNPSKVQLLPFLSLPVSTVEPKGKQELFPTSHELQ